MTSIIAIHRTIVSSGLGLCRAWCLHEAINRANTNQLQSETHRIRVIHLERFTLCSQRGTSSRCDSLHSLKPQIDRQSLDQLILSHLKRLFTRLTKFVFFRISSLSCKLFCNLRVTMARLCPPLHISRFSNGWSP